MSKNKKAAKTAKVKKTIATAPVVEAPKTTEEPKVETTVKEQAEHVDAAKAQIENPAVAQLDDISRKLEERGLDPNHRVDLMTLAHNYYHKDGGEAAKKAGLSQELIDSIDHITMISIAAEYASEMTLSKTPFAISLRKTVLPEMQSALKELGITMQDSVLALPEKADGTVEIKPTDIKTPVAVKKEIKKTIEARNAETITDPSKITNEKDLAASLMHYIANVSVFKGLNDAINFYRSYLKIQAGDDTKKVDEINSKSIRALISEIADVIGTCPFVTNGFGSYLYRLTREANSVVPAYAQLYLAVKNPRTGNPNMSDEDVADMTAALIDWTAKVRIAAKKKNLEVLKKDPKKNEAAIKQNEEDLKTLEDTTKLSIDPSSDFADNLLENMKLEDIKKANVYKHAFEAIRKAYYPKASRGASYVNLAENIQQRAGIITNLFRAPLAQLTEYNAGNLTDLVEAKSSVEEKPAETKAEEKKTSNEPASVDSKKK